jgi:hypothetical protein
MKGAFFACLAILASCDHGYAGSPVPNSLRMTCAQAKHYVALNDGAVLATGDAYASFHSSYCSVPSRRWWEFGWRSLRFA